MGQAREALINGAYVNVLLSSITLNVCHTVPDYIVKIPRQVVISIHPLSLVMSSVAADRCFYSHPLGASQHGPSIPCDKSGDLWDNVPISRWLCHF